MFNNTPAFSMDQRPSISVTEVEERIKADLDMKYQSRLADLEKRSAYLDKSLELIEEMRTKFLLYE